MANHMRAELVCDTLTDAIGTRGGKVTGVVFHSDRGTQYCSGDFADLCAQNGVLQSVGRTGVCWDNAPAESFLATLKKELVHRRGRRRDPRQPPQTERFPALGVADAAAWPWK